MKTAVIYYSYEGNSILVADIIKTALKADVYRIKTIDKKKRSFFGMILRGGFQVVFKKKPPLEPLSVDVNAYDLIILVSPVWAGSPAPAMISFLDKTKISGKKIALFFCHGGGLGEAFAKFRALVSGNSVVGEIGIKYPAKMEAALLKQKVEEWVKTIKV